jgi:hypothetical protein
LRNSNKIVPLAAFVEIDKDSLHDSVISETISEKAREGKKTCTLYPALATARIKNMAQRNPSPKC